MPLSKIVTVDKIISYQKKSKTESYSVKLDGMEVVLLDREMSEILVDLLQNALDDRKEVVDDNEY